MGVKCRPISITSCDISMVAPDSSKNCEPREAGRPCGGDRLNPDDQLMRESQALRERLSRLSQASLRITEDLDLDAVLHRVLEGARLLTGAARGGLTVIDDAGRLEQFISSGLTEEAHRGFVELPGGPELFAYLSSLPEALRVSDFGAHSVGLGLPEIGPPLEPLGSFLGAPIRLQNVRVGNLYLSDKEGEEGFSQEDEDTLVLFASQAALAIANARRHREERRARADLETLIDTSPVGVVVFDAVTGAPKSFNREARRIVDILADPDQTPEDLLEVLTFRRADGREVSLKEFPPAQLLSAAKPVRVEEIVISVPDGRSVTTIINSTPIMSPDGTVESVVVTMQDMTPLEEVERLRAEFLAVVSHELRMPLTSIKGSAATIMDAVEDLDPAVVRQFVRIIGDQADHMNTLVADLLDVARIETGTLAVGPEPAEVAMLVERARSAFTNAWGGDRLEIDIEPDLPLVLADRRRIVQVLLNLLGNAARHSPAGFAHPGERRTGGRARGGGGLRRGAGHPRGTAAPPLPHVRRRAGRRSGAPTRVSASPSARGSWRRTAAVSAPRATVPAWARASPSRCRPSRTAAGTPGGSRPGGRRRAPRSSEWGSRIGGAGAGAGGGRRPATTCATSATPWHAAGYRAAGDRRPRGGAPPRGGGSGPKLALLDLMLPDADGVELMQADPARWRTCRSSSSRPTGATS